MYGVEILANVIESVWSNRFIVQAGQGIRFALLVVLGAITGLVCARPWLGLVLSVVVAGLYFSVASVVFDLQGVMLDLLFPFMSIALSYAAVTAYRFSIETRRRREIMRLFAANVTPEVARSAITAVKSGQITLSGQAQEVSVLLADMRGYSAYAETHDPQEVMDTIRSFRDMMVQAVFEFEGTIAQYEGEQLMALFNAPLPQSDHPWRAVEAAMAMKARIETYHQSLPADHPHRFISAGYGIYTGRAIVGNTGGDGRYAYTAIGDTVDLAVHLAGSAKVTQILLGEATYERVETLLVVETLPTTLVRGNTTPITVFAAVAPR
jgi:adenylate cyclase